MIVKTVKTPEDLIQSTPEDLERLRLQGKEVTLGRVLYALDVLQETMANLSRTAFKRTEFEMAVVRLGDEKLGQAAWPGDGICQRGAVYDSDIIMYISGVGQSFRFSLLPENSC